MTAKYSEVTQEVIGLADVLIKNFHPYLKDCNIGFVFRSEASTSGGKTTLATTSKVTAKFKPYLTEELDILIVIAEDSWSQMSLDQRRALIDHQLCHITFGGTSGWTTRCHDIEEFEEILDRHGLWKSDLFHAKNSMIAATVGTQLDFLASQPSGKLVKVEVKQFAGGIEVEGARS